MFHNTRPLPASSLYVMSDLSSFLIKLGFGTLEDSFFNNILQVEEQLAYFLKELAKLG